MRLKLEALAAMVFLLCKSRTPTDTLMGIKDCMG